MKLLSFIRQRSFARYIFVTAERASVVGVYRDTGGQPELVQLLPSGSSPESAS